MDNYTDNNQIRLSRKRIFVFLIITFALSAVIYVLTLNAKNSGSFGNRIYGYGIMWCPALAAYITCKITGRNLSDLGWKWGKSKYMLWCYFIPFFYALIGYGLTWLCRGGGFYNKTFIAQMAHDFGYEKIPVNLFLILFLVLQGTICMIPSMSTALGEEIGWRGFLVPELFASTKSYTKTAFISGVIWAVWHYPVLIFGNYNSGTPIWYSLPIFTIGITSISFIFTWFRLKSNSLWTGVMLHASHNLFIQGFFNPITISNSHTKYFTDEFGLVIPTLGLLLAIYFWMRRNEITGEISPSFKV